MVGDAYRCPACGRHWQSWPCDESYWTWACKYDGTRLINITQEERDRVRMAGKQ